MIHLLSLLHRRRIRRERLALLCATALRRRCQRVIDADRAADDNAAAPVRAVRAVLALRANADRAIAAAQARRAAERQA